MVQFKVHRFQTLRGDQQMIEAAIIPLNVRGGCATIGDQVHALFRVSNIGFL
jgi:hypothetical protein